MVISSMSSWLKVCIGHGIELCFRWGTGLIWSNVLHLLTRMLLDGLLVFSWQFAKIIHFYQGFDSSSSTDHLSCLKIDLKDFYMPNGQVTPEDTLLPCSMLQKFVLTTVPPFWTSVQRFLSVHVRGTLCSHGYYPSFSFESFWRVEPTVTVWLFLQNNNRLCLFWVYRYSIIQSPLFFCVEGERRALTGLEPQGQVRSRHLRAAEEGAHRVNLRRGYKTPWLSSASGAQPNKTNNFQCVASFNCGRNCAWLGNYRKKKKKTKGKEMAHNSTNDTSFSSTFWYISIHQSF